jgi:transcriptional regulator with XRE-family HTH domain
MTTTTATVTTGRAVAADDAAFLKEHYTGLVKWGEGSVRAAWRFGQALDSRTDLYTRKQLAEAVGVTPGTVTRYLRLYYAYQRPELAEEAARALETYNIDTITALRDDLAPIEHGRPMAGRRFRYRCTHCGGHEVRREEYDPDAADQPSDVLAPRFEAPGA